MKRLLKIILFTSMSWGSSSYANFSVAPTQMYLLDKQRSTTVTLDAQDIETPKQFEMQAYKWTQNQQGEDVLEPDSNILLNPKIFVIKPNTQQMVRVGFLQPLSKVDMEKERAWRIVFKEIPSAVEPNAVQFMFNISLPLFVGKQHEHSVKVQPSYMHDNLFLTVQNNAPSHLQVRSIKILDNQKKVAASSDEMQYLLSSQQKKIDMGRVKLTGSIENYTVNLETDRQDAKSKTIELKMKE